MKKVLLMLVAIMAFGLISCGDNKPTGDPKGDADKFAASVVDAVKNAESAKDLEAKIDDIIKEFQEVYKDNPEKWAEFGKALENAKVGENDLDEALKGNDKITKEEAGLAILSAVMKAQKPMEKKAEEKKAE